MTFLFLGIDGMDYRLADEYNFSEKLDDGSPVSIKKLEQNLPEVISEKGEDSNNDGLWTFYIWGAIASGQVETPQMRQEHPSPSEVEYPLRLKYLRQAPKSIVNWVRGRLKRRERYRSFAWDDFNSVKVINYPLHLPEYTENSNLIKHDAISRSYGPLELDLLKTEINNAIRKNYDAVFVVTRMVDCVCHGATSPLNFDVDSWDEWMEERVDRDFEDVHESGMDMRDFAEEEELDVEEDQRKDATMLKQDVLDHVEESYDKTADLFNSINWDGVDEHVIVSDHGFKALGAGSVNAHGRNAVLSCSFGYWRKMSAFIENWREGLLNNYDPENDAEEKTEDEKVKEELEKLGYNT